MKITEITVKYGKTINIGNYQSERIDMEATAEIGPTEDHDQAVDDLRAYLEDKIQTWEAVIRGDFKSIKENNTQIVKNMKKYDKKEEWW